MKFFGIFVLASTVFSTAFAAPDPRLRSIKHVVHEKREASNSPWVKRSLAERDSLMPMRIGLTQRNLESGHDLLMEISDPASPKYGKHLSDHEVIEMFAPSEESKDAVLKWLHSFGISPERISISRNKQWIQFDARVVEAEALLHTTYHIYEHEPSGRINIACDQYHVPEHVKQHIDYITPGIKLFHLSGPLSPEREEKRKKRAAQPEPRAASEKASKSSSDHIGFHVVKPIFKSAGDLITSILYDLSIKSPRSRQLCSRTNDQIVSPYCVKELYGINTTSLPKKGAVDPNNKMGIFQSLGQRYSPLDNEAFNSMISTGIPPGEGTPELRSIDGGPGRATLLPLRPAGAESNLDIQSSQHIIYPQSHVVFSVDDQPTQENYYYQGFLNNFFDGIDGSYCSFSSDGLTGNSNDTDPPIDPTYPNPDNVGQRGAYRGPLDCGTVKPTYVTSISYGGLENTLDLPANYQKRQCSEVMKLGIAGHTFVVASGDSGVAINGEYVNNPNGCLRPAGQTTGPGTIFNPGFPSNCPYFLTVGSTEWNSKNREIATTAFGSGGGFSNVHAQPDYQKTAVSQYLANANLPFSSYDLTAGDTLGAGGGVFNRGGRAYPDVSAIGWNIPVIVNGALMMVGGTSASAPIVAGILTVINELRLKAGKGPVGFVNPTLYANPDKFK
ncbi:hypothetical protein TWF696_003682 [Orbilia brochopaga]|uniref:tripeptidyl-peptidase II n=1 Tax=Orbilia brochopaga TaxID=3140254 RepID=A0AAV9V4H7_9PEZI